MKCHSNVGKKAYTPNEKIRCTKPDLAEKLPPVIYIELGVLQTTQAILVQFSLSILETGIILLL